MWATELQAVYGNFHFGKFTSSRSIGSLSHLFLYWQIFLSISRYRLYLPIQDLSADSRLISVSVNIGISRYYRQIFISFALYTCVCYFFPWPPGGSGKIWMHHTWKFSFYYHVKVTTDFLHSDSIGRTASSTASFAEDTSIGHQAGMTRRPGTASPNTMTDISQSSQLETDSLDEYSPKKFNQLKWFLQYTILVESKKMNYFLKEEQ